MLDNIDPAPAAQLERILDFSKTALIYTSKSGSTPETAANFIYFYKQYKEAGGDERDIVIICDKKENGKKFAQKFQGFFNSTHIGIWPEIARTIPHQVACHHHPGQFLCSHPDIWIGFIILKLNIVLWTILFDQVAFQD